MSIFADISYDTETLDNQSRDLKNSDPGKVSPTKRAEDMRLLTQARKVRESIKKYRAYQFDNPTNLGPRINDVNNLIKELKLAQSLADAACHDMEITFRKLNNSFELVQKSLTGLNNFFLQNEDNTKYIDRVMKKIIDDDRKQKGFEKHTTKKGRKLKYGLSKGVVDANEKSHRRHDDVWGHRLRRDFKGVKRSEFLNWLKRRHHDDKNSLPNSAVFNVTCFLLEKNKAMLGGTSTKFSDYKGPKPTTTGYEDHSPSRLYFAEHHLYGLYTLIDKSTGSGATHCYAMPGIRRKSKLIDYLPVHTLDTTTKADGKTLNFLYREQGSINKCETPMSMKYVMRHDYLYMGLTPNSESRSHAEESDFKSIQSAGAIVADKGTILVIDNASGHYQPGWELLVQAVKKVRSEGGFGSDALVGVVAQPTIYYFPDQVFLDFAKLQFKKLETTAQWKNRATGMKFPAVQHQGLMSHLKAQHFGKMSDGELATFLQKIKPR